MDTGTRSSSSSSPNVYSIGSRPGARTMAECGIFLVFCHNGFIALTLSLPSQINWTVYSAVI